MRQHRASVPRSILSLALLTIEGTGGACPFSQVETGCVGSCDDRPACVPALALLVGGSNLAGWRSDAEIIGPNYHKEIADFPYTIDAPYGLWGGGKLGAVVCGGKNWDDDVIESRCWRYDPCSNAWEQSVPDMPIGTSGGAGIEVPAISVGEEHHLWVVGGGNGSALNYIQVLTGSVTPGTEEVSWEWRLAPSLIQPRYGHCGVWHSQTGRIVIAGGHDDAGVMRSIERINPEDETVELMEDEETPRPRWGGTCQTVQDDPANENSPILLMGGMDEFFLPHPDLDIYRPGLGSEVGPELPWGAAGALGVPLEGANTLFGGFSLAGFQRGIASINLAEGDKEWTVWSTRLSGSRVSGLALAVPEDLFDYCP